MSKKDQIQQDFLQAFKDKNEIRKAALSSLKAKIIETEKANSNKSVSDDEVLKIIAASIKQRRQSVEAFNQGGRHDLADKEQDEIDVLQQYLPKQMSRDEIKAAAQAIMSSMSGVETNPRALIGRTMGAFGKQYVGQADMQTVKEVVEELVAE